MNYFRLTSTRGYRIPIVVTIISAVLIVLFTFHIYPKLQILDTYSYQSVPDLFPSIHADIEDLKIQNRELLETLKVLNSIDTQIDKIPKSDNFQHQQHSKTVPLSEYNSDRFQVTQKEEPGLEYEVIRRQIDTNINEFWYYIRSKFKEVASKSKGSRKLSDEVDDILKLAAEHKGLLLHYTKTLSRLDGYENWRAKEAQELSKIIEDRFHSLQNPPDCKTAKKFACKLNLDSGLDREIEKLTHCFLMAYATERTLVIESNESWEKIFHPLSETCTHVSGDTIREWPGTLEAPLPPSAVPEDLARRVIRLHGDPYAWWIGKILKYLLRPQKRTADFFYQCVGLLEFRKPIVGVYIRRTNLINTKTSIHSLEEYMTEVDAYYDQMELIEKVTKRRIYLASDDPGIFPEARKKYPTYEILGDPAISKSELYGNLLDIHLLSITDFLVCTFSSAVCRIAYALMQSDHPDASARFRSFDDTFHFGFTHLPHSGIAVIGHKARTHEEIDFNPGDVIEIEGNRWDGFSKGKNQITKKFGAFPGFKTKEEVPSSRTYSHKRNDRNYVKTNVVVIAK